MLVGRHGDPLRPHGGINAVRLSLNRYTSRKVTVGCRRYGRQAQLVGAFRAQCRRLRCDVFDMDASIPSLVRACV
jgi:hypothetical protein